MAGLMGTDWDAYRQQAGQQTANLNQMPFVMDPAKMTADPTSNSQMLYGRDVQDQANSQAGLTKVVQDAFKAYYGRDAKQEDLSAWVTGAMTHGLDATALRAGIEEAALKSGAGPGSTAGFASGLMGNDAIGLSSFGSGMMGR